jgi:anti-anti-sigma regulatory factor
MPFSIASTLEGLVLKLEGTVTIRHALDLMAALREGLEGGVPIGVDTGGLEDADTCILQLLSSLRQTVPALCFDDPSEAFIAAVDRCGLRRQLLSVRESL